MHKGDGRDQPRRRRHQREVSGDEQRVEQDASVARGLGAIATSAAHNMCYGCGPITAITAITCYGLLCPGSHNTITITLSGAGPNSFSALSVLRHRGQQ